MKIRYTVVIVPKKSPDLQRALTVTVESPVDELYLRNIPLQKKAEFLFDQFQISESQ